MKQNFTAVIASSGTTSGVIDLSDFTLTDIFCPITSGTAITLEVSLDGTNFFAYNTAANAAIGITKTAGSATCHQLALPVKGVRYVRVKSGSTEAAARTFTLVGVK